jgi:hypothetical protein
MKNQIPSFPSFTFFATAAAAICALSHPGITGCSGTASLTDADYAKAGALYVSCEGIPGINAEIMAVFMKYLIAYRNLDDTTKVNAVSAECMLKSKSCDEFDACTKPSNSQCAGKGSSWFCDGSRAVHCSIVVDENEILDCGAAGLECFVPPDGEGSKCIEGKCDKPGKHWCEGNILKGCGGRNSTLGSTDCGLMGAVCVQDGEKADCTGTGDACNVTQSDFCDGDYIVSCLNGKLARQSCSAADSRLTCSKFIENFYFCLPKPGSCDYANNKCNPDGTLDLCFLGGIEKVDCNKYGFAGCESADGGPKCKLK